MFWRVDLRGIPEAMKRPRSSGARRGVYQPHTQWEADIQTQMAQLAPDSPMTGPLFLRAEFRFQRPKSYPKTKEKPHTVRPDVDNCLKSICDCAVRAGVIADDSAINAAMVSKRYCRDGEPPGATVEVSGE
jgi:Holliday junction resolvase RusA-like endonuclease